MNTTSFTETILNEIWFIPLDILLIICTALACILSFFFLIIILFDRTCHTVPMLLVTNSCLGGFLFGCSLLGYAIFTFLNDLQRIQYQDSLCTFRAYIGNVAGVLLNTSFLLQAIHRYISVIYPNRLFLLSFRFQFFLICLAWIYAFAYSIPFTVQGKSIYNVDNQICQLPIQASFYLIYAACCIYIIPVSIIILIYFKLIYYVHRISQSTTPVNTLFHARRELKMVQRIVMIIGILLTLGLPYASFVIMSFFTSPPKYHFRIAYIFVDISLTFVLIALFQFTDPLKASVRKQFRRRRNTVAPSRT